MEKGNGKWPALGIMGGLGAISLLVFGQQGDTDSDRDVEALLRLQTHLELSHLKLQRDLQGREVGVEESRLALADWLAQNADLLDQRRELLTRLAEEQPSQPLPHEIPSPAGLTDSEFLARAGEYLSLTHGAIRGDPHTTEELDKARKRLADWRAQPGIQLLLEEVDAARQRQREAAHVVPRPINATELAELPLLERAEAEFFNLIVEVFSEPLAEGEEGRDRLDEVRYELELWQQEILRLRYDEGVSQRNARILELEAELVGGE